MYKERWYDVTPCGVGRGAATDSGPPGQHFHSGPPAGGWGGGGGVAVRRQRMLNAGAEGVLDQ